jgi:NAD(P)H-dependent FMN reductase
VKDSTTAAETSRVLFVTASPRGESHSVDLAQAFLDTYCRALPDVEVDRLNTFTDLPSFGAQHVSAKMAVIAREPVPEAASHNWAEVLAVADRVRAADTLLFAVPMWNGGIPWSLKLFIDVVTQPGVAFSFDPSTGYTGCWVVAAPWLRTPAWSMPKTYHRHSVSTINPPTSDGGFGTAASMTFTNCACSQRFPAQSSRLSGSARWLTHKPWPAHWPCRPRRPSDESVGVAVERCRR